SMATTGRSTARTRSLSPVERNPYLALCARLGMRLGRIATWSSGLGYGDRSDETDYAVRSMVACSAFGFSLLAERIRLSGQTRRAIAELVRQVNDHVALDRNLRPEECPYMESTGELYRDLEIEIEIHHGDDCRDAFELGYQLFQLQMAFQVTTRGERKGSYLRKVLYSARFHEWVADNLILILDFCEHQPVPLAITPEVRRFASGFIDRSLSAAQIMELRSLLLDSWHVEIERYFSPIHGSDVSQLDPDFPVDELVAKCFRLGELYGQFEMWIPEDEERTRADLKRLQLLLNLLHLPLDTQGVSSRLNMPGLGGEKPVLPAGVSGRADFDYWVTGPLEEVVECLYGTVLKTVVVLGLATGSIAELSRFETRVESDEAREGLRSIITGLLGTVAAALDCRWVRPGLRHRVQKEIERWPNADAVQGETWALSLFLSRQFRDQVLKQACATLASGRKTASPRSPSPGPFLHVHRLRWNGRGFEEA
ncbi:MAG TPA: hypothetical protein VF771_20955, partial [Longimicrobiaceae bacterium]